MFFSLVVTCLRISRQVSAAALLALAAVPTLSIAQGSFPEKPLRLIVPYPAGGVVDSSARLLGDHLGRRIGQQVIIEIAPAEFGNAGTQRAALAEPDGYTLLYTAEAPLTIHPHLWNDLGYNPERDFAPIGRVGNLALILAASPGFPVKGLDDIRTLSKLQTSGLSYATSGNGSVTHLMGEMLARASGANLVAVPYRGGGSAMTDAVTGNIPLVVAAAVDAFPHLRAGRLRALGVATPERLALLPDVPTLAESGAEGFSMTPWIGILAPVDTPRLIVDRLNVELNALLEETEIRDRLAVMGINVTPSTPEAFHDLIRADVVRYGKVIREAGIKAPIPPARPVASPPAPATSAGVSRPNIEVKKEASAATPASRRDAQPSDKQSDTRPPRADIPKPPDTPSPSAPLPSPSPRGPSI